MPAAAAAAAAAATATDKSDCIIEQLVDRSIGPMQREPPDGSRWDHRLARPAADADAAADAATLVVMGVHRLRSGHLRRFPPVAGTLLEIFFVAGRRGAGRGPARPAVTHCGGARWRSRWRRSQPSASEFPDAEFCRSAGTCGGGGGGVAAPIWPILDGAPAAQRGCGRHANEARRRRQRHLIRTRFACRWTRGAACLLWREMKRPAINAIGH